MIWLGIAVLGGAGALARWWVDGRVSAYVFALGLVAGAALEGYARQLAATGLLGGYTTFSTWMLDTDRLWLQKHRRAAAVNLLASLAIGLAAVWLGRPLG